MEDYIKSGHTISGGADDKESDDIIRVLVLDDEAPLRDIVRQNLIRAGCTVTTVADGGEGLRALLNDRFDVVISDLNMEPMDGITFLTEALRIWPWLGVVVFSGFIDDDVRNKAAELGISAILEKPVSFTELTELVMEEAQRRKTNVYGSDQITLNQIQYELTILREVTKSAIESSSFLHALRSLSNNIGQMLPSIAAGIFIEDENEDHTLVISVNDPVSEEFITEMRHEIEARFSLLTAKKIDRKLKTEIQGPVSSGGISNTRGIFSVPIIRGNKVAGMLTLVPPREYTYNDAEMSLMYHAANHLTTVLMALQRIREIAVRDELTGLHNRHHLQDSIETIWSIADRYGYSTGILIFDIDHFKTINDNYGHLAGDKVLQELAEITTDICRKSDIIARYGGDEVVVVMPNADHEDLRTLSERLLSAVREHIFCADIHNLRCTISIGGAGSRTESGTMLAPGVVMGNADNALYVSKRNGRDRCSIWHTDLENQSSTRSRDTVNTDIADMTSSAASPTVAVIDDDEAILSIVKLLLEMEGCETETFATADEARAYIAKTPGKLDIALVDLNLDGDSGLDLIQEFHESDAAMVMIIITGDATLDNAVESMRRGAYDFIQKPIQREQLKMTLSRALEYRKLRLENMEYQLHLEDMVRRKSRELTSALQRTRDSFEFTLRALTNLLDAREQATGQHSQRVQDITKLIAQRLGISGKELEDLQQGALLHDIGKIGIPDRILLKNGPLDDDEWKVMRKHAMIGYDIIKSSPDLKNAAEIVGKHHERWDGTGYPDGLKGEDIPLGARIFALADSYDAMRSDRPYRKGMDVESAVVEINKNSGSQFDPELVEIFNDLINEIEDVGGWESNENKA